MQESCLKNAVKKTVIMQKLVSLYRSSQNSEWEISYWNPTFCETFSTNIFA